MTHNRIYDASRGYQMSRFKVTDSAGYSDTARNFAGGPVKSTTNSYANGGSLVRNIIVNTDNSANVSHYGLSGGAFRQDLYDASGKLTGAVVTRTDGSKSNIVFLNDGGSTLANQTDVNAAGVVVRQTAYNKDGSYLARNANGTMVYSTSQGQQMLTGASNNDGSIRQFMSSEYGQYVKATALTLATQFSRILFSNNLPAALAVGAFSGAAINTAFGLTYHLDGQTYNYGNALYQAGGKTLSEAQAFLVNFGTVFSGALGGVGGAQLGADLFRAIGLPANIGAMTGGLVGSVGAQYLATEVAKDFFDIVQTTADGQIIANSFTGGLQLSSMSAAGSYLGSQLSQLVIGNGGIESQIGGTVGAAAAGAVATSLLAQTAS